MLSGMTIWHNHPSKRKAEAGSLYQLIRFTTARSSSIVLAILWRQPMKVDALKIMSLTTIKKTAPSKQINKSQWDASEGTGSHCRLMAWVWTMGEDRTDSHKLSCDFHTLLWQTCLTNSHPLNTSIKKRCNKNKNFKPANNNLNLIKVKLNTYKGFLNKSKICEWEHLQMLL